MSKEPLITIQDNATILKISHKIFIFLRGAYKFLFVGKLDIGGIIHFIHDFQKYVGSKFIKNIITVPENIRMVSYFAVINIILI